MQDRTLEILWRSTMQRVTGLGGVFFKAEKPEELYQWYEKHLGLQRDSSEPVVFKWRHHEDKEKPGMTVWAIFPATLATSTRAAPAS